MSDSHEKKECLVVELGLTGYGEACALQQRLVAARKADAVPDVLLLCEHPWFGVGMNTIRDAWWKFDLAAYRQGTRSHFHSTPIQLAVDLGLPALAAWVALMGVFWCVLAMMVRRAREQKDVTVHGLALGLLGGTSGFLLSSLVQYNFGDSVVVLLFWFLAGVAAALRRHLAMRAA